MTSEASHEQVIRSLKDKCVGVCEESTVLEAKIHSSSVTHSLLLIAELLAE